MGAIEGILAPCYTLPFGVTTLSINLVGRAALLLGYTIRETTGAAAADIDILDGNDFNGAVVATVTLLAGQSLRDNMPGDGIYCQSGPFLRINSGSVRGALWTVDVERSQAALAASLNR